jgi:hypothetical protein
MSSDPRPRIHCTACNAKIRIPYEAVGRWITCPRCGHEFAAILEGLREPSVVDEEQYVPSRQRLKCNWGWALIVAGLAALVFLLTHGRWGYPETCKELVTRVRERGLPVSWGPSGFGVYVWWSKWKDGSALFADECFRAGQWDGIVKITQMDSEQQAFETAGRTRNGYSFGRFFLDGDPKLLEAIRKCL